MLKSKSLSHAMLVTALAHSMGTTITGTPCLNLTGKIVDDYRPAKVGKSKKTKAQKKAEKKARKQQRN
jgi:hypothetical protein